ncbi:TetR/AcrR family transcriptional regulator [Vitiosangium sp. GDMCC 1.1324]|uniref:TetR/AcrR family transcriptional regulator n=1 Tax=Vitiosangium sp. (strain GDMCC 1.1324) TaxID=2138576 RepID=UPI000D38EF42|nr:TetR/AcrR family transcriptional regulator [Vitiosangium sp. GDMCC 1.1324]PTL81770.1 hypothetical protein DAT35_22790 [Vitiosangium sp. GDMCC 1.1324]
MSRTKAKKKARAGARVGTRPRAQVERVRVTLTLVHIFETALRLVDTEGLESLTMRRLATELGVGATTLYGYVSDKEELLEGLAEFILREQPSVKDTGDWVAPLRTWFMALRRTLRAHPGMAHLFVLHVVSSRPFMLHLETHLEVLRMAGISGQEAVRLWVTLLTHTLGFVLYEAPRVHELATLGEEGRTERLARWMSLPPERFSLTLSAVPHLMSSASDEQFEFGLDCLLDGIRARSASANTAGLQK